MSNENPNYRINEHTCVIKKYTYKLTSNNDHQCINNLTSYPSNILSIVEGFFIDNQTRFLKTKMDKTIAKYISDGIVFSGTSDQRKRKRNQVFFTIYFSSSKKHCYANELDLMTRKNLVAQFT